jgi:hypothetical protein
MFSPAAIPAARKARTMDMNQLLRAHQIALMGEARAATRVRRAAYDDTLVLLAGRIRQLRIEGGVDTGEAWFLVGDQIPAYRDR